MSLRSILEIDARLSNQMRVAEQPGLLRNVSVFFAHSGDSWFWALALLLIWFFAKDPFWRKWSVVLAGGIAVLIVVVMTLKFTIRRRRPEGEWGRIYRNTDPHSFPSGHAARAFLIAVMATGLGPTWVGILLWVWAPLVAMARVAMGVHFASDIVAGMIVGIAIGLMCLEIYTPILSWVSTWFWFPLW